jgi:hypothetical protein
MSPARALRWFFWVQLAVCVSGLVFGLVEAVALDRAMTGRHDAAGFALYGRLCSIDTLVGFALAALAVVALAFLVAVTRAGARGLAVGALIGSAFTLAGMGVFVAVNQGAHLSPTALHAVLYASSAAYFAVWVLLLLAAAAVRPLGLTIHLVGWIGLALGLGWVIHLRLVGDQSITALYRDTVVNALLGGGFVVFLDLTVRRLSEPSFSPSR